MRTAEVYLWGTRIGSIAQDDIRDVPVFSYEKSFIGSGMEPAPLMMPLSKREYSFPGLNFETFHGLPGMLSDSLPDKFGNRLIQKYLSSQGRDINDLTSVERLLYTGSRGMGALEYVPAQGFIENPDVSINVDELVKLASDILSDRENIHIKENDNTMAQILKISTSAGGARAKALVAWNRKTGDIRSGQIDAGKGYEYYLIKFDGVDNNKDREEIPDEKPYTRIEYAYYNMAVRAGIIMNPCEIYMENGLYHFMTKRFDRTENGQKLHMQTLGAIAHYDFNDPGAHSYEQCAFVMSRLGIRQDRIEELYRRMVFNILAGNHDDHVKNISFLMDKTGVWDIAPAYDITYAYNPANFWLSRHQMSAAGKTENFTKQDLLSAAKNMNIKKSTAEGILREVTGSVTRWMEFASKANVPEKRAEEIRGNFEHGIMEHYKQ